MVIVAGDKFADMIFLRFKAEFRYPECPIPLNFITIRFFRKVRVRVRFRISWVQHLTKKLHRDNVKIESAKYSLFGISIRKWLDLLLKYMWSKMKVATEEIRTAEWDNNCSTKL